MELWTVVIGQNIYNNIEASENKTARYRAAEQFKLEYSLTCPVSTIVDWAHAVKYPPRKVITSWLVQALQ